MDDAKIDELCQRIYKNHRQAIDLIFERRNDQATVACGLLHELVKQRADYWHVVHATSRSVYFVPKEWHSFLPPIGEGGRNYDPRAWLLFAFEIYREGCWLVCYITPTSDSDIRQRVLESLTAEGNRWKFRVRNPTSNSWLRLRSSQVSDTHWGSGPDAEGLLPSVGDHLEQLQQDLAGVPDALRPIIAEWEKSHREVH